jgi:hypothetical protein
MKKIGIIIVLLAIVAGASHYFGARDLSQIALAMDKYGDGGKLTTFFSDIVVILEGGRVKEAGLPPGFADKTMYRWTDEFGQLHLSEKKPDVEKYQEIKFGDLKLQIQPGMTPQEVEAILKNKQED